MKERPILFNDVMVRAILEGRKTQTRRVARHTRQWDGVASAVMDGKNMWCFYDAEYPEEGSAFFECPYGQPGDRVWVRETWAYESWDEPAMGQVTRDMAMDACEPSMEGQQIQVGIDRGEKFFYRATDEYSGKWKPSIFMPRHASRITLEVAGVRVERVQEISHEDAEAEGMGITPEFTDIAETNYRSAFKIRWSKIYPGSWDRNDYVWVVEFKRI